MRPCNNQIVRMFQYKCPLLYLIFLNISKNSIYLDNIVSAPFEESISFMFEGVDDEEKGPFNNSTRMLLVDNILRNLTFATDKQGANFKYDQYIRDIVYKNLTSNKSTSTSEKEILSAFFSGQNSSDSKILYRGFFHFDC